VKNKLALDICRCASTQCSEKENCLRYLDIPMDERYSISDFYNSDDCKYMIGVSNDAIQ
jgi:hypothetical protein